LGTQTAERYTVATHILQMARQMAENPECTVTTHKQ
jgi:hypothetical protein